MKRREAHSTYAEHMDRLFTVFLGFNISSQMWFNVLFATITFIKNICFFYLTFIVGETLGLQHYVNNSVHIYFTIMAFKTFTFVFCIEIELFWFQLSPFLWYEDHATEFVSVAMGVSTLHYKGEWIINGMHLYTDK